MKRIIDYFIDNSLITNLITLLIIALGIFSILNLRRETFPNVDFGFIQVRTLYPGASAEDVEQLVSIPLEKAIETVDGIETMNTLSGESFSIVFLKIDPSYEVKEVEDEVKDALDLVQDLPEDVEESVVTRFDNDQKKVASLAITGGSEQQRRMWAKRLEKKIEDIDEVTRVTMSGYRDEIVDIQVNPLKLEKLDLALSDIADVVKSSKTELTSGKIEKKDRSLTVRFSNEKKAASDFENIIIRSNVSGKSVFLKDIASIQKTLKDKKDHHRESGKDAIFLAIQSKDKADILKVTDEVKLLVSDFWSRNEIKHLDYKWGEEIAFWVKRRLRVLGQNGTQGLILVFVALLLFMNFRVSFLTSLGAPLAFFVAFACMSFLGLTINLISMFGLILVLGMLVDDSIIVAENFYQYVEKGWDNKSAAKQAAMETLAPVTATILTTMIAFGAIFFMGGIMGKFLWPVPMVVIICLIASWFECFFILPGHLADFSGKINPEKIKKPWYNFLLVGYAKLLSFILRSTWRTFFVIIFFGLSLIGSLKLAGIMRFELFPGDDVRLIYVNITGPVGASFERTDKEVVKLQNKVLETLRKNEIELFQTIVGTQTSREGTPRTGDHYGTLKLFPYPSSKRDRTTSEIVNEITRVTKGVSSYEVTTKVESNGPPKGLPIKVELSHESLDELIILANNLKEKIAKMDGVTSIDLDYEDGVTQYIYQINEIEAKKRGVSSLQIALELRRSFEGEELATIRKGDEDIDIVLRLDKKSRSTEETLDNIKIRNRSGRLVPLSQVTNRTEKSGAYILRRFDRKNTIAVQGDIDLARTTSLEVNQKAIPIIEEMIKINPDLSYKLDGENKDTQESISGLFKAGVIALFCIFLILVIMFASLAQPLIIMSAIPLGLIGVIITFFLMDIPISFMAGMGIIGLIGVVVNDSIVLVSFINNKVKKESLGLYKGVIEASVSRFRPVILTTFTTVAGLLPLAHSKGGDPFLKPMAISFAYGLIFATLLTLIFIPCCSFLYFKVFGRKHIN